MGSMSWVALMGPIEIIPDCGYSIKVNAAVEPGEAAKVIQSPRGGGGRIKE